jgi:hypothetical protein
MDLESMVEDVEVVDAKEAQREEWLRKRLGKITCSRFGDLIGEGREKGALFTQTGYGYLRRIVAERLGSWYAASAKAMDWGIQNESEAAGAYSFLKSVEVDSTPFQYYEYNDDIGGTPDGLVGLDGCIEIKCPYDPAVHVNTLLTKVVPKDYEWQVVGHLLVTGRKWCDFISYDPRIKVLEHALCVVRVERDEARIDFLKKRLELAVKVVGEMVKEVTK